MDPRLAYYLGVVLGWILAMVPGAIGLSTAIYCRIRSRTSLTGLAVFSAAVWCLATAIRVVLFDFRNGFLRLPQIVSMNSEGDAVQQAYFLRLSLTKAVEHCSLTFFLLFLLLVVRGCARPTHPTETPT